MLDYTGLDAWTAIQKRMQAFKKPCGEFQRLKSLLDGADVAWDDASEIAGTCYSDGSECQITVWRLQDAEYGAESWSCIWGYGTYGSEDGLLELSMGGWSIPQGWLTADEAFQYITGRDRWIL
jgi:hypothetical protein